MGLTKAFGDVSVVAQLDLAIERGQVLALLGASGCGKTTVLRLIAGFEVPDSGTVEVGGRLVAGPGFQLPPEKRHVGMVFQDYALFPHLTVVENVAYGLPRGRGRQERVRDVLSLVGLTGLEARMPHELSGGEQQRVALARALAPRPIVALLDEPFSNVDAGLRVQLRQEVRAILKATASTAIFVTHDRQEALFMGDRVAVMQGGRIEQVADPQGLFHHPATRFVAEFMGVADFLPAHQTDQGLITELGVIRPLDTLGDWDSASGVEIMVRPDDLTLEYSPQGKGRVVSSLFQGSHSLYEVVLASGHGLRVLQPHTAAYAPGTAVDVHLTPGHDLTIFAAGRAAGQGAVVSPDGLATVPSRPAS